METILLEEKYILEYIRDILNDSKIKLVSINDAKFHHNTSYEDASSVCKHGILSLADLNKLGIKNYSEDFLRIMNDTESHINGVNAISLSVVGLKDLYSHEEEYCPFSPDQVDFLISSGIKASRTSIHYGNEFLSYSKIGVEKLRSVDVRILLLIRLYENFNDNQLNNYNIQYIINRFNLLKDIAISIKESQLDISFREMSSQNNHSLDIDKISVIPKLMIKRN